MPVVLRLASLNGADEIDFANLLALAVGKLEQMEAQIKDITSDTRVHVHVASKYPLPTPPHRSITLHQRVAVETI